MPNSETPFGLNEADQDKTTSMTPEEFLAENVGEGKKYPTEAEALAALAKKALHADSFIAQLKGEKSEMEQRLSELAAQSKTTEDILNALKGQPEPSGTSGADQYRDEQGGATPQGLTRDEIAQLAREELLRAEAERTVKERDEAARKALVDAFGTADQAAAAMRRYTNGDETKLKVITELGRTDPAAVVRLLQSAPSGDKGPADLKGDSGPAAPGPQAPDVTWKQAMEVKRTNPRLYASRDFQRKLLAAAQRDPNFYNRK